MPRHSSHYMVDAYRFEGGRAVLIDSVPIVAFGDDQAVREAGIVEAQYPEAAFVVRDGARVKRIPHRT